MRWLSLHQAMPHFTILTEMKWRRNWLRLHFGRNRLKRVVMCGSAWHVGMAAQYVFEDIADIPVRVELASEFRYRKMPLDANGLVVVVSQSGETADTLAALRESKNRGFKTLAIVNVVGSSIARGLDVDKPRNLAKSVTVE